MTVSLKKNKIYALIDDQKIFNHTAEISRMSFDEIISGNNVTEEILSQLQSGDTLLVQNVLRLGNSVTEIATSLNKLAKSRLNLCLLDEHLSFKAKKLPDLAQALLIALELHKSLISLKSKSALQEKKANGIKLGRPCGLPREMKLDNYKDDILEMVKSGVSKELIAKKYNVCRSTVYNFIKKI